MIYERLEAKCCRSDAAGGQRIPRFARNDMGSLDRDGDVLGWVRRRDASATAGEVPALLGKVPALRLSLHA